MRTLDECIDSLELLSSVNWREKAAHADVLHYLKTYRENQQAYEDGSRKAEEARERYVEAVQNCERVENRYKWINIAVRMPQTDGQYLTFVKYRDKTTAVKLKLWKDGTFTSEPKQVLFWMPLPPDPEE